MLRINETKRLIFDKSDIYKRIIPSDNDLLILNHKIRKIINEIRPIT